jgi:hypothetical protein
MQFHTSFPIGPDALLWFEALLELLEPNRGFHNSYRYVKESLRIRRIGSVRVILDTFMEWQLLMDSGLAQLEATIPVYREKDRQLGFITGTREIAVMPIYDLADEFDDYDRIPLGYFSCAKTGAGRYSCYCTSSDEIVALFNDDEIQI